MANIEILPENIEEVDPILGALNSYIRSRFARHKIENMQEAAIINDILNAEVKPNGENFGLSLKKIINATRVILQNQKILFIEDEAMNVAEKLELNFISYPVDFSLVKDFSLKYWYYANYSANINYFYFAAHEHVGLITYYLTGKSSKIY